MMNDDTIIDTQNAMPDGDAESTKSFSCLLIGSRNGNREALDELVPLVYRQLHSLASRLLKSERSDHTLRTTALVHEAWLRLAGSELTWQDRSHFFGLAARLMRQVLVDHARRQHSAKRGGEAIRIPLEDHLAITPGQLDDMIVIDDSLTRLARLDQRKSDVIELICFGGLSYAEAAKTLQISEATLHRDLTLAKAWIERDLRASDIGAD
jgi:RNA polymerase sigma-70 factor (ECF subfamily)